MLILRISKRNCGCQNDSDFRKVNKVNSDLSTNEVIIYSIYLDK